VLYSNIFLHHLARNLLARRFAPRSLGEVICPLPSGVLSCTFNANLTGKGAGSSSSIKFHWSKTNFALRKNVSKREAHNARIVTKDAIGDIGTVERGVAKEALEKVFDLDECGKFAHISGFVYIGKEFWASKQEWAKARNWKVR